MKFFSGDAAFSRKNRVYFPRRFAYSMYLDLIFIFFFQGEFQFSTLHNRCVLLKYFPSFFACPGEDGLDSACQNLKIFVPRLNVLYCH